jgi:hypothetical protein
MSLVLVCLATWQLALVLELALELRQFEAVLEQSSQTLVRNKGQQLDHRLHYR